MVLLVSLLRRVLVVRCTLVSKNPTRNLGGFI